MATASATAAQALCSTDEKENYQRLSRLIMCAGTELFRALFDSFYPPNSLGNKLSESGTKGKLCNVLLKPQRDRVYPPSGLCGESRNFDISLLSKLLKVLCRTQLPPLPSGWDDPPSRDDLSLTADIVRVKLYRNDIIHTFHKGELSDTEFCLLWDGIKMALLRIASKISAKTRLEWKKAIEKLQYDPLTPEAERNAEELQEWYHKDMDTKECLAAGFARVERQIQSSSEEGKERSERLEKEIQAQKTEIQQLREVVMNRPGSSLAVGASLRIIIDVGSMTSRSSREEPPAMTVSFHAQPNASADKPPAISVNTIDQLMQRIASELRRHYDRSTTEENQFVQHLEDVNQVPIVNVNRGSLILTVKCSSLKILERLWQDYSSGHLGKIAQEFLVTERVLEDLGLVELKLKITISEEDYRECRAHFTICAGSDYPDKREGEQKEDCREEEYIPSPHPTDFRSSISFLPSPIRHFVSRKRELSEIKQSLCKDELENDGRCILLLGPVGMGKTSTAIKAADEILHAHSETVAAYVNCRFVTSLDDLAGKIVKQLYHFPFSEPAIGKIKSLLIEEEKFHFVLLLDNFEFLTQLDNERSMSVQAERKFPSEKTEIMKFVKDIATKSKRVHLLVTSTKNVDILQTGQRCIRLLPFNENDSFQLLTKIYGDTPLQKETACKIAHCCGGVPFVLFALAAWQDNPSDLLEMLTNPNRKEKFARISDATEDEKIEVCIDVCFNRLNTHHQNTLVSLTVFRGLFTISRASRILKSAELRGAIVELARMSFLEQHMSNPYRHYSILTAYSLYCQNKIKEVRFREVFFGARKMFINYVLAFLEETFKSFLSTDVSNAIVAYRHEDESIMQLIDWLGENGAIEEDQEKRCIDVFNKVGELLAKMMGKKTFDRAFTSLKEKCKESKDQKRLSECLTSLGIREVFSCCCSPDLCDEAAGRAKPYLLEADRIQSDLGIITGNSRAQCLAKLGRCLVKEHNFTEGKEKIQQAIEMRKARGEADIVMQGATYNDLAVALSLEGNHEGSIKVREKETLEIYRKHLGDRHPFTATILNNLSNNYSALDENDIAKKYSEEALKIRRELLKDHYDTAKSLFDLGMVYKKKEEFKDAKACLEECQRMQRVLDDPTMIEELARTINELECMPKEEKE